MGRHWFTRYLSSCYSSGKKLGLDLGCGHRGWSKYYNCSCIGLDLPTTLKYPIFERPDVCGNVTKLPFKENSFDFVACYSVIPYVEKIDDFFIELFRVMKPDGIAVIIIQNLRGLALNKQQKYANQFDSKTLHKKLADHGFKSIKHYNMKTLFYSIYYNMTSVYAYAIVCPHKK